MTLFTLQKVTRTRHLFGTKQVPPGTPGAVKASEESAHCYTYRRDRTVMGERARDPGVCHECKAGSDPARRGLAPAAFFTDGKEFVRDGSQSASHTFQP